MLSGRAEFAKGSPANPMSYEEVAEKFRGCAEFAKWPKEKTEAAIEFVKTLESAPDMSKLLGLAHRLKSRLAHLKNDFRPDQETHKIASIPGDGIGRKSCPKASACWKRPRAASDFLFRWKEFDWSCERLSPRPDA